ncbi:unnamed protein product [Paramecium pentaurelia]|uniref:Proteasome subunit beta n=1 Tax=Paramecium pentaurelia TaxID=43138 RepID=A0A8S1SNJ2_9CILI|nr:unnamed protein product [Paramecium pentaurelia]
MDSIFGLQGGDFVIVACDGSIAHSILKIKETEDKILKLDDHKIFGISGEGADRNSFGELVHKNHSLIRYKTGAYMNLKETAHFVRSMYAQAIRSRDGPHQCNGLLGGVDSDGTPSLYWLDYLGSLQKITRGAQGYANYFLLGLLDNQYKPNLTKEEGIEIIKKCIKELQTRFLIAQNKFIVKIVTKQGIEAFTL